MTWTYSGDPGSSTRNAVRFLIGDTDTTDQLLTDEELDWLVTQNSSNTYQAAVEACRAIEAKFARMADRTVGDLSVSYSQKAVQMAALKQQLIAVITGSGPGANPLRDTPLPYAGGISESDKDVDESDSDRVEPWAQIGVHDFPWTGHGANDVTREA